MKIGFLLAAFAVGFGALGCSSGDSGSTASSTGTTPPSAEPPKAGGGDFKIALLTPGSVADNGWNKMAYDALQKIKTDTGATVDNQQDVTGTKIRDAMQTYARQGYGLVFGHGFEYNEPALAVAKEFPNTVFVSSSGAGTAKNVGAFRFYLEQGCYLEGYLAAKMSKTGVIGSVAVQNFPSIVSTLKAYEAGAKAANPNVKVIPPIYFGTEGDIAKAKQATEALLGQNADFVIHQANAAAKGVFDACAAKGVSALGTNSDQNDDASGAVVASSVIKAGPAFEDLAKRVKDKSYTGEVTLFGMDKDVIDFVINPKFASKVPADLVKKLEELKADMKSGKLVVPKDNF